MYPVEIRDEPAFKVAALPHQGAYAEIGPVFDRAYGLMAKAGAPMGPAIGLYYDNPQEVAVDDLRSHAGCVSDTIPDGMDEIAISGGRVAVLTMVGPYTGLPAAWHFLHSVAMPERGLAPADDGLPFERYMTDPANTPVEKNVTEICVPVRDA